MSTRAELQLRPDVRQAFHAGQLVGLERSGLLVTLPSAACEAICRKDSRFLAGPLAQTLNELGFLESVTDTAASVDRNRMFADAMTSPGPSGSLKRLETTPFVIAGCGGLGSNVAVILASLGSRNMTLVDFDVIDTSNLNRLLWATEGDVGSTKVRALQRHLRQRYATSTSIVEEPVSVTSVDRALRLSDGCDGRQTVIVTVDEPEAARSAARGLHASAAAAYLHAGYVGQRVVVGPYVADAADPCPFCGSSGWTATRPGFIAPSAAPNNLVAASFVAVQLLRAVGLGDDATVLRRTRWIFDLVLGQVDSERITKSHSCEVCSP